MLLAITSCCKFTKELQQTQMMKWMDEYDEFTQHVPKIFGIPFIVNGYQLYKQW